MGEEDNPQDKLNLGKDKGQHGGGSKKEKKTQNLFFEKEKKKLICSESA